MALLNKFNMLVENLAKKVINFNTDTLKVMLTNTLPVSTNAIKADITDIAAGHGYSAGGTTATFGSGAQTAGVYKLVLADVTFTAAGGTIGPFRYAVLYDDTPGSPAKPLVGWYDYGSAITLADGEAFTVDLDQTNGALTLA